MKLKYLRTKPRKLVEVSPCIAEMGAMIQCWTASGVDDPKCAQTAKMLTDCMKSLVSLNLPVAVDRTRRMWTWRWTPSFWRLSSIEHGSERSCQTLFDSLAIAMSRDDLNRERGDYQSG